MADDFHEGDFYRLSDRTGRKVRASQTRQEWTGRIVEKDWWDPRQPQDFVRGLHDRQTVPRPRPDIPAANATFGGPYTTKIATAAPAGTTALAVTASAHFTALDYVRIMLDNNDTFRAQVSSIPDATHITLVQALPWAASVGNLIVNMTANVSASS